MAAKPSVPKGTRDFSPLEVHKRRYIMQVIQRHFEQFGFQPIETPSFENSETLMGKYGEEGDRLIFKILNSGDFLDKISPEELASSSAKQLGTKISEKALRYDLTVPFARYVVQHQNELEFPFKRYQIQPVWRADRPQKGRFREFYQCDADVVGSQSLWQEVEFIQLYDAVFTALGLVGTTIKINNRKILSGLAQVIGAADKLIDFTVALDKLDKIGEAGVQQEMLDKGLSQTAIDKVSPLFHFTGTWAEKLAQLKLLLTDSAEGLQGITELETIGNAIHSLGLHTAHLELDVTLARGLNYYTGAIFEVAAPKQVAMGSIGGGGRYDDLTGIFGLNNVSGVGISFGLDRIYLVLDELNLFPESLAASCTALFVNYGQTEALYALQAIKQLRANAIAVELYPDAVKMGKQFAHADKRQIPYVVIAGSDEMQNNTYALKNLAAGTQEILSLAQLIDALTN